MLDLRRLQACGAQPNKPIEQKAALSLMCPSIMLGGEGVPCPPYGRATLGTLQLMGSVMLTHHAQAWVLSSGSLFDPAG